MDAETKQVCIESAEHMSQQMLADYVPGQGDKFIDYLETYIFMHTEMLDRVRELIEWVRKQEASR